MSRTYRIRKSQLLPVSLDAAWDFFSDPSNLRRITPPQMGFTVTSEPHQGRIYAGQIIEYRLKPVLGIPVYWMTEITRVEPGRMFIDEQRFGPYSFWHHQHHFEQQGNGTLMTDIVHYRIPLGWLGDVANSLFVQRQLEGLFRFRTTAVDTLFGNNGA